MLQDLHVLSNFLLALNLFIKIPLTQTFDRHKVTAEFMLRDAYFTEGPFTNLVSDSVEFVRRRNRLAHFLKVSHDHRHQVLLVL